MRVWLRLRQRANAAALVESLATSGAIQTLNIVTGIALARGLGPEHRGELAAVILWSAFLSALASLGVGEAAVFTSARRPAASGTVLGTSLALALVQGTSFAAIGALALPRIIGDLDSSGRTAVHLMLAYIPLSLVVLYGMSVLNGQQEFRRFNAIRLLTTVATASALVILALSGHLTVASAAASYAGAELFAAVLALVVWRRSTDADLSVDREMAGDLLRYGWRVQLESLANQMNRQLDQLVISIFLPASKLGIYVVAATLTSLAPLISTATSLVAVPAIAKGDDSAAQRATAHRFLSLGFTLCSLVTIPMIVVTPVLVHAFFGEDFSGAIPIARLLLVASVLLCIGRVCAAILKGLGKPLDSAKGELVALAATCASLAIFLPTLELTGAAVASIISYGAGAAWMLLRAARILGTRPQSLLVPSPSDFRAWRSLVPRAEL